MLWVKCTFIAQYQDSKVEALYKVLFSTGCGTNKEENVFLTHGCRNNWVHSAFVEGVLQSLNQSHCNVSFHPPGMTCPVPTHSNDMLILCNLIKISERLLSFPFNSV